MPIYIFSIYYTYIFDLYGKNCTSQATKRRTANIVVTNKLRNDKFTTKAFYKIDPTAGRCITGCSRLRSQNSASSSKPSPILVNFNDTRSRDFFKSDIHNKKKLVKSIKFYNKTTNYYASQHLHHEKN